MAFNTSPGRAEYTATAGQTLFTFTFKIYTTANVLVYLTPSGQTPNDTTDILLETTDYTVVINGDNGGDVTLASGASAGDSITLVRSLPIDRDIEFQANGDFTAATINADQDYQTYLLLDNALDLSRSIKVPDTAQGFTTELPPLEPNKMFIVNQAANGIDLIDPSSSSFFSDAFIVSSMSALLAVDYLTYGSTIVKGYYAQNDGGGGLFNWDSTIDKSTANAGTIIDPSVSLALQGTVVGLGCWVRQYSGTLNVKWFGAKGDGITDDTSNIQNAIDVLLLKGGTLFFPSSQYNITSTITIDRTGILGTPLTTQQRISIVGEDKGSSSIKISTNSTTAFTIIGDATGSSASHMYTTVSNITFVGNSPTPRTSDGLKLQDCAYLSISDVTFHNFNSCMVLTGCLSSTFDSIIFNESATGITADIGTFSGSHANIYNGCEFRQLTNLAYNGYTGTSQAVFIGCQFEGCGTHGNAATGGLIFRLNTVAGEVGPSFYGCYFEANGGGFDLYVNETATGTAVANIYSCNFNRTSSTKYVVNNIFTFGTVKLNLNGCSFTSYGTYVPSVSNKYIFLSGASILIDVGCRFEDTVEKIITGQKMSYSGIALGSLGASVTGTLPNGWTISQVSTGIFNVNHNLGHTDYACVSDVSSSSSNTIQRVVRNTNFAQFIIVDIADLVINDDFTFMIQELY